MKLTCRRLLNTEYDDWNAFVKASETGTVFHQTSWLCLTTKNLEIIGVWDEDLLIAGVALVKTRKNGVYGYHIPPYTQYFSPIYYNRKSLKQSINEEHKCIDLLINTIGKQSHIDFKLPTGHHTILPYYWKGFECAVAVTHLIKNCSIEEYRSRLKENDQLRKLKKWIKRVEQGEVVIDNDIDEKDLRQILRDTSNKKGFDAHEDMVVKMVNESNMIDSRKIAIRSVKSGILAFGFFPYDNKAMHAILILSSAKPDAKDSSVLLLNVAIEYAIEKKLVFDFEGSMLKGIEFFFRKMGGEQSPVYRLQKSGSLRYSLMRAFKQIINDRKA